MKGKRWILLFVGLFLILITPFIFTTEHDLSEQVKVDRAYQCLENKVLGNCVSMSLEEKTFSLLAINQCGDELINESETDRLCWPSGNCGIKETAQAIIALDNAGLNTDNARNWLLGQGKIPRDVEWFLEVDTLDPTICSVTYSGNTHLFSILENKKLSNNAGSCLLRAQEDYWFEISTSCFLEEFEVSCDDTFLSTLLFKKAGSPIIHVSPTTSSASAGKSTFEKIDSSCLGINDCDYEGTLWSTIALDSLGEDVSKYLPYIITSAEDNKRLIPEAFLYLLTGDQDYRSQVLQKQKNNKWWSESGDRYYDTAVALLPFQSQNPTEKQNSKNWLLTSQDGAGCWENNLRNTAFILSSLWPKNIIIGESHAVCVDNLCVEVPGYGINKCDLGESCIVGGSHSECSSGMCVTVPGPGFDECIFDSECSIVDDSHADCVGNTCVEVPGPGFNECDFIGGSCEVIEGHAECVNEMCVKVDGPGADLCFNDGDCTGTPLTCEDAGNECMFPSSCDGVIIDELSFSCFAFLDCCDNSNIPIFHSECVNDQCREIDGPGTDECTFDSECVIDPPGCEDAGNECMFPSSCDGVIIDELSFSCFIFLECCDNSGPPVVFHSECVNDQCREIDGPGTDECFFNSECVGDPPVFHSECIDSMCREVPGIGTDECFFDSECSIVDEFHTVCSNSMCREVIGPGTDECFLDAECEIPPPIFHSECVDSMCREVPGIGTDECFFDSECSIVDEFHTVCSNSMCREVFGPGTDECFFDAECEIPPPVFHSECIDSMCREVPGSGTDECIPPCFPHNMFK